MEKIDCEATKKEVDQKTQEVEVQELQEEEQFHDAISEVKETPPAQE